MKFGLLLADVPPDLSPVAQIDAYLRQVEAGQEAGMTHFMVGHHFLYGELPWHQPFPLLGRLAAAVDDHVTLGTGVIVTPLYPPVLLAEEAATLDAILGGRFVLGLGTGYRQLEFDAFGIPMEERVSRLEETIEVLRKMWTRSVVDHDGRHFRISEGTTHLTPARDGGPPIWLGARSRAAVRRAARIADGWLVTSKVPFDEIRERWAQYQAVRHEHGLPVSPLPANRQVVLGKDRDDALRKHLEMTSARLDAYEARGLVVEDDVVRESRDARQTAFLGTPEDVIGQIQSFEAEVPLDPLFVRVAWPGRSVDDSINHIEELGREVIPALREFSPPAS